MSEIDALLTEDRRFPPSAAFRAAANISDPEVYARAARDPEAFWAGFARELEWMRPWDSVLKWDPPNARWFDGGHAQRERQLPRSARPRRAPQQGRHHLGRRARRPADADVLGLVPAGQRLRQRPQVARREARRSRGALSAAHPRAGHLDARVRANRRGPQRRLRRLQRRVAARSHQRLPGGPARDGRWRLPPRPGRTAQADGRRSAPRRAVDQERRRRAAPARCAHSRGARRRPGSVVSPPDAARRRGLRAGSHERGGHALRPLHVRHDRQAEGHRAHDGRISHRLLRDDEMGVRPQGGRRLLVHRRHRLGDRPQLRRLRAALEWSDRGDVRRRAGLAARRIASGS